MAPLTITAKRGWIVFGRGVHVTIDGCTETLVPWKQEVTLDVDPGEHRIVVVEYDDDVFCWVDDAGLRVEYVVAGPRSLLGNRFTFPDGRSGH